MSEVKKSITVEAPVDVVYRAWHNFENFPRFMDNIEEVRVASEGRSHWKVKGPLGTAPEWDAEITLDEPEKSIGWRSIEGSSTKTAGRVDFTGRNTRTDVAVTPNMRLPLASSETPLPGSSPISERQVDEDLHRFKEIMEQNVELSALNTFSPADNDASPGKFDRRGDAVREDSATP